jgi:glycine/D-amino acid oxidase-like deaminating enzyme
VLRTQFATTFPLEITGLYEKQFSTGGGMSRTNPYDLVIIGGGIAGSSLACSMAKAGARVLLWSARLSFAIAFAVKFAALGEWQKFIRSGCPKLFEIAERARYAGSVNIWDRNRLNIATSLRLLSPGLLSTPSTIRACKLRCCKRLNRLAPRFGGARASALSTRALRRA